MGDGGPYQIVYMSRAADALDDATVERIAAVSRANNAAAGISGLLLFDGQRFIQAIEGSRGHVTALMTRIALDPRHRSITYVSSGEVGQRQFGGWSMNFRRAAAATDAAAVEFMDLVLDDVGGVPDPHVRAAFIGFAVLGARSRTMPDGGTARAGAPTRGGGRKRRGLS